MDFLPRHFVGCALACALGLVSLPAFAVLDSPNYSWRLGSNGNVYKVYDPQGPHLSSNFTPDSTFAENSASNGVIESVAPGPLTIDGATGEILNGVSLSRGLTVGDLIDGVSGLLKVDNPVGLALLTGSLLAPLLIDAYDNSTSSSSGSYPSGLSPSCGVSGDIYVILEQHSYCNSTVTALGPVSFSSIANFTNPPAPSSCSGSPSAPYWTAGPEYSDGTGPYSSQCPGGSSGNKYVGAPVSQQTVDSWAQNHPNQLLSNLSPLLTPADQTSLANNLANDNAPLPARFPYGYQIPSSDATVQGSPTTTSSTDPSTGNTTTTTSTPSYKFSTPTPPNGVQVQKITQIVTQTCTSAGSCTTTNTTTNTSPATQPKLGSFIAPTLSAPTTSAVSPTSFPLTLTMPNQSSAVCPSPLSYSAFGQTFNISVQPLCTLATNARPYVEALGAVGAGILIFH